jgi:hypothetical protein
LINDAVKRVSRFLKETSKKRWETPSERIDCFKEVSFQKEKEGLHLKTGRCRFRTDFFQGTQFSTERTRSNWTFSGLQRFALHRVMIARNNKVMRTTSRKPMAKRKQVGCSDQSITKR